MRKQQIAKEIAKERIYILIANALHELKEEDEDNLANAYARLVKKIAMRLRLRLPYEIRQLYCKKCKYFIIPGRNSRIRIGRYRIKGIRITCLRCGYVYRKIIKPGS